MPNPTDMDRMSDSQTGATIINIDDYRKTAAAAASLGTTSPLKAAGMFGWIVIAAVILCILFLFKRA